MLMKDDLVLRVISTDLESDCIPAFPKVLVGVLLGKSFLNSVNVLMETSHDQIVNIEEQEKRELAILLFEIDAWVFGALL